MNTYAVKSQGQNTSILAVTSAPQLVIFYGMVIRAALITLFVAPAAAAIAPVNPDLNRDGIVNAGDLAVVTAAWETTDDGDLDGDGDTDSGDLAVVLAMWEQRIAYSHAPWDFGGAEIGVPVSSIDRVLETLRPREDGTLGHGWTVTLELASSVSLELHGTVVWWMFRLHAAGWEGVAVVGFDSLTTLGLDSDFPPPYDAAFLRYTVTVGELGSVEIEVDP